MASSSLVRLPVEGSSEKPVGATSLEQAIEWTWEVRRARAELIDELGGWSALVADEGGLASRFETNEEALRLVTAGIERAGFAPGTDCGIAIDVAASQLTVDGTINLSQGKLTAAEWLEVLAGWAERYPIVSLEDVLDEDEWTDWSAATSRLADLQILGDDLFATYVSRLERGIANGVANAVLVKVNQAGTVTRAERVVRRAHEAGYNTVVSARSGDTGPAAVSGSLRVRDLGVPVDDSMSDATPARRSRIQVVGHLLIYLDILNRLPQPRPHRRSLLPHRRHQPHPARQRSPLPPLLQD